MKSNEPLFVIPTDEEIEAEQKQKEKRKAIEELMREYTEKILDVLM